MSETDNIKSLWGDLPLQESIRTPSVILKEQASILTKATNGLLIGDVSKKSLDKTYYKSYDFECQLKIKVPSINNYSISIIEIRYPITGYPLFCRSLVTKDTFQDCQTEEDFNENLARILSSQEVKKIISGLLSEVRADTDEEK